MLTAMPAAASFARARSQGLPVVIDLGLVIENHQAPQ